MAYTPKTWVNGETADASEMNHIEQGIAAISATGAIGTANLADASVTNNKLDQDAVDSNNIRAGGVITTNIADGAVATAKIEDGAVTADKIASSVSITNAQIDALF